MASLAQRIHDKGWDQGIQQGIQQGMQEGIQQGELKGKLEGKLEGEHNKAVEFARRLLQEGFSAERAAQLAGLPEYEVELLNVE